MISLYFFVILFAFSAVMLLYSLIHQRWNDIPIYFVLLGFSFISIGAALTVDITIMVDNFENAFGGR